TMARPWQAPRPLLAILVTLVAFTYQAGKKTFIDIHEVSPEDNHVPGILNFTINKYNQESDDAYNFRVFRILKIQKQITDHMEYHLNMEIRRTTCRKLETTNCKLQQGQLYKKFTCNFTVFTVPWFDEYEILKKNCSSK
uniref:Cystatin 11 n=1 Tax=Microcebus murinus TaxID=30608 RepID=A0A8C5XSW6_MICMU